MNLFAATVMAVCFAQAPAPANNPNTDPAFLLGRVLFYVIGAGVVIGIVIAIATSTRKKRPRRRWDERDDRRRSDRRTRNDRPPPARRVDRGRETGDESP